MRGKKKVDKQRMMNTEKYKNNDENVQDLI